MANSASAKKRIRQNEKRRVRNRRVRTRIRTWLNKFDRAMESGDLSQAELQLREVESVLNRAVSKGVIPKKRAARKTSRLAKRLNKRRAEA